MGELVCSVNPVLGPPSLLKISKLVARVEDLKFQPLVLEHEQKIKDNLPIEMQYISESISYGEFQHVMTSWGIMWGPSLSS